MSNQQSNKPLPTGKVIYLDYAYAKLLKRGTESTGHCYLAMDYQLKQWQWEEKFRVHGACPHCEGTGEYIPKGG